MELKERYLLWLHKVTQLANDMNLSIEFSNNETEIYDTKTKEHLFMKGSIFINNAY